MREIEIKVRVHDSAQTLAALERLGVHLSNPKKQHDVVYARPDAVDSDPDENWLRVRTENDRRTIFTLKRSVVGEMDSIEHETVVENGAELTAIIKYLGYELFSDLTKVRRTGHHGDVEVCFDQVPPLGTFLEVEKLCAEDADHDAVEAELWALLQQLGTQPADQETSGYDVLMRRQAGLQPAKSDQPAATAVRPIAQQAVTFEAVNRRVWQHLKKHDWHRNPPRGLAISLALEAGELLEHYQWSDNPVGNTDELADVLIYAFEFAQATDIDMAAAIEHKLQAAARKYPAEKFKGKSTADREAAWLDARLRHHKEGL